MDAIKASDVCKDLISGMLIKDPKARLSIEQVLAHPFFADSAYVPTKDGIGR